MLFGSLNKIANICCYKIVKIMDERYQLLSKEVEYITYFISDWEVFDFDNLQKVLDEMKELQQKMKQNYDPHEGE